MALKNSVFTRQELIDHCRKVIDSKHTNCVEWAIKRQEHEIFYRLLIGVPLWRVFPEEFHSNTDEWNTHIEKATQKSLPPHGGLALSADEMWQVESYMRRMNDKCNHYIKLYNSSVDDIAKDMQETENHPWRTIWRILKSNIFHL